jgi:FkbM family methyltransferase
VEFSKKNKQDHFLDIGSNCGYYALFIAKTFPNTNVLAFEPIKKTYDKLIKNIHLNDLNKQIQTFNFGLSDANNKVQMRTLTKKGFAQSGGFTVHDKNRELKTNETLLEANLKIGDELIKYINKKLLIFWKKMILYLLKILTETEKMIISSLIINNGAGEGN